MGEKRRNRVTVVMEDSLKTKIEELAAINKRSVSDFIRLVCWEYVEAVESQDE